MKKTSCKMRGNPAGKHLPYVQKKVHSTILPKAVFCSLTDQDDEHCEHTKESSKSICKRPAPDPFFSQLLLVLEQHYTETDFTVEQMAKSLAVCSRTLHRKTMLLTGLSASKIIRLYRLHKAVELLQKGYPVSDAAYFVGFANLSYFTKCFRTEFNICPSHYRITRNKFFEFR